MSIRAWFARVVTRLRPRHTQTAEFWFDEDEKVLYGPFADSCERDACQDIACARRKLPGNYWIDVDGIVHGPFATFYAAEQDEANWDGVTRTYTWFDDHGGPHGPFATAEECKADRDAYMGVAEAIASVLRTRC